MNYTSKYRLPQWDGSDRVLMEDFNSAMSNIETGLTAIASTASAAKTAAAAAGTAAEAAQTTADSAYSPDNKPYVTGSYTGTGKNISVYLDFQPSFLIISGMKPTPEDGAETEFTRYFAITGGNITRNRVALTTFGFAVFYANNGGMTWPMLTEKDRVYDYIAFR